MDSSTAKRLDRLTRQLRSVSAAPYDASANSLRSALLNRGDLIAATVRRTLERSPAEQIARIFLNWMRDGSVVRVIGAGRARLAAAIPANRLAHGGARVFIQHDLTPMPNSLRGGGVLAASASGQTRAVLDTLSDLRHGATHITIVGIARADARSFHELCHCSISIEETEAEGVSLSALSDIAELAIAEVLDALVVAAGRLGGFDERKWRLGHEDIGDTGPYGAQSEEP